MLSDRQYQLLTAYIDGEMDARDREVVLRLLEESAEARVFLQKLQSDAGRVRRLPPARLDSRFPKQVIAAVSRPRPARRFPMRVAAAAAVLLAVALGAWALLNRPDAPVQIVQRPAPAPKAGPEPKSLDPQIAQLVQATFAQYGTPVPEIGKRLAANDPSLVKELASLPEPAAHIEIRCRDTSAVLARLQNALSGDGVKLWVDPKTRDQLKKGEQAEYVLLAENLPPAEIAKFIQQASQDEQFDSVLFNPLQFEHRKELSALLGVSVFRLELSRFETVPVPRDPEEFGFSKTGQAIRAKANVTPTPAVPVERVALVSSGLGEGRAAASTETLRFLNSRRGNRPGTLQVVIVLQPSL